MTRRCPECPKPPPPGSTFCCAEHKAAYHNRATVRGRALTPLTMATRITRGGSRGDTKTGRQARLLSCQMMQRWVEEDREAARMDAVEYLAQRWEHGI